MKKYFYLLALSIALLASCSSKTHFKDFNEYNKAIFLSFSNVQTKTDSLENILIEIKYMLENNPNGIFKYNEVSSKVDLEKLSKSCVEAANKSEKEISGYYFDSDTVYKPAILKGLSMIKINLNENFVTLVEILKKMDRKPNNEILQKILPFGKNGYTKYQEAFKIIENGQMQFDASMKYTTEQQYFIRFGF